MPDDQDDKLQNQQDSEAILTSEGRRGYLSLPFNREEFAQFLTSLLGRPQEIRRQVVGRFEIQLNELVNLYYLVEQRLQQNEAALVDFNTTIEYNDGTTVNLNSFDSLTSYNEIKPVISTSASMQWTYLVKFPDKEVPEKQEIEVNFSSSDYVDEEVVYDIVGRTVVRKHPSLRPGPCSFRIAHTSRSWGTDIEALLSRHLLDTRISPSRWNRLVYGYSGKVSEVLLWLIGLSLVGSSFIYFWNRRSLVGLPGLPSSDREIQIEVLNAKVDTILAQIPTAEGIVAHFIGVLCSLVIGVFSLIFIGEKVDKLRPRVPRSFILLTGEAQRQYAQFRKRTDRRWILWCFALVGNLAVGVAANYVFYALSSHSP